MIQFNVYYEYGESFNYYAELAPGGNNRSLQKYAKVLHSRKTIKKKKKKKKYQLIWKNINYEYLLKQKLTTTLDHAINTSKALYISYAGYL